MLDFSDPNNQATVQVISAISTALATIILAFLTGRYVRLTNQMLKETRASRGPNVYIDIELEPVKINLIVGNAGLSPAHNIQITVSDSIPWKDNKIYGGFKSLGIIKDGISYLAPGRILKYRAGFYDWKELIKTESNAEFIVTFEDQAKKQYRFDFLIDMSQYQGVMFESFKKPESEIVAALQSMERNKSSESTTRIMDRIGKKGCPFCGEQISAFAKKCPHCLEFLVNKKNDVNTKQSQPGAE